MPRFRPYAHIALCGSRAKFNSGTCPSGHTYKRSILIAMNDVLSPEPGAQQCIR